MQEIYQFSTKFIVAGGSMYVFDLVMGLNNNKSMYDALIFGGAAGITDILVNNFFSSKSILGLSSNPQSNNFINNYLIKPVITVLIYTYLYDSWYRYNYVNAANDLRNKNNNYLTAYGLSILSDLIKDPVYSLFGWNVKY